MSGIIKYSFVCYGLIALGQLWLYALNLRVESLFDRVTLSSYEWIGSHVILLVGAILILPTTIVLREYLKNRNKALVYAAIALTILGAISLIGQYLIDFYLVELFDGQSSQSAYQKLDRLRSNSLIKFLCYDLIAAWLLGQVLFIVALYKMKNYPRWALGLYLLGVVLVVFGSSLHELFERISYIFISISYLPIFKTHASQ